MLEPHLYQDIQNHLMENNNQYNQGDIQLIIFFPKKNIHVYKEFIKLICNL